MSWPLARRGEFPDMEAVALDILGQVTVEDMTIGLGTWRPSDSELPYIYIRREMSVGGLNPGGWEDTASLFVGTWSDSRRVSQAMIHEVRRVFRPFARGGGWKGVFIDWAAESSAPGQASQDDEDDRFVESGWTFVTRRHRGSDVFPD